MDGLSIEFIPAFYWNTVGLQVEYPLNFKLSVGVNILYSMGLNDEPATFDFRDDAYLNGGIAFDGFAKYFFSGKAPEGVYAYANISYNNILYFDGNNRPYTLHNHWREFQDAQSLDFKNPNPLNGGLGAGYQVKILKHLIADVLTGVQLQTSEKGFYPSVFILPSVGYVF